MSSNEKSRSAPSRVREAAPLSDAERDRQRRLEELFHLGVALPPGDQRAFVDRHCGTDRVLADDLLALLAQDAAGPKRYLDPPVARAGARSPDVGVDRIPEFIDRYHLLRQVGEGGMGRVFHARQMRPIEREVAIKIPKRRADRHVIERRFARERQLLAGLDHPGIVRVLDGGATDRGDPYAVMEYIPGASLDRYCRDRRPARRELVGLIIAVCEALHHAHVRGVVHSDLKPSNIIITNDDRGRPVAKLIDFGVARRIDDVAGDTGDHDSGFTPTYASPERIHGEPPEVRDDVYAMGVLLREAMFEARVEDAVSKHAKLRARRAERELIAITRTATKPLRAERYESIAAFADDLRRWAAAQVAPVRSFGATVGRWRVLAAVAMLAVVIAAAIHWPAGPRTSGDRGAPATAAAAPAEASGLRALEATSSNRQHEMAVLLSEAIALVQANGEGDARLRLSEIVDRVVPHFRHTSCSEGVVRRRAAESFLRLGDYARATENLRRAFDLGDREPVFSRSEWFSLVFHFWQASLDGDNGDPMPLGWSLVLRARRLLKRAPRTAERLDEVIARMRRRLWGELGAYVTRTTEAAEEEIPETSVDWLIVGSVYECLGSMFRPMCVHGSGFQRLVERLHRDALAAFARSLPNSDPRYVSAALNLAETLLGMGRAEAAEAATANLLADLGQLLPVTHWKAARARSLIGACRSHRGRAAEARDLLESAARQLTDTLGPTARGAQEALRRVIAHHERVGDEDAAWPWRIRLAEAIAFSRRPIPVLGDAEVAFGRRTDDLYARLARIFALVDGGMLRPVPYVDVDEVNALTRAAAAWCRRRLPLDSPRAVMFARFLAELASRAPHESIRRAAAREALTVLAANRKRVPIAFAEMVAIAVADPSTDASRAVEMIERARAALDESEVADVRFVEAYGRLARAAAGVAGAPDANELLYTHWQRLVREFGISHRMTVYCLEEASGVADRTGDVARFSIMIDRHLSATEAGDDNQNRLLTLSLVTGSTPGLDGATYRRGVAAARRITRMSACAHSAIGMGCFRVGEYDAAVGEFKQAIRLHEGDNPADWAYWILTHRAMGSDGAVDYGIRRLAQCFRVAGHHADRAHRAMREVGLADDPRLIGEVRK